MNAAIQNAGNLAAGESAGISLTNRFAHRPVQQGVDQAAQDFEGMFLAQMLQPMFDTVGVDPIFGGGHGEEAMRGFLVQEYGKIMAKGSPLGIAAAVQKEMVETQQKMDAKKVTQSYGAANAAGQIQ